MIKEQTQAGLDEGLYEVKMSVLFFEVIPTSLMIRGQVRSSLMRLSSIQIVHGTRRSDLPESQWPLTQAKDVRIQRIL